MQRISIFDMQQPKIPKGYVSEKIARRLKRLGYSEPCRQFLRGDNLEYTGEHWGSGAMNWNASYIGFEAVSVPTPAEVLTWFRTEHNIFVSIGLLKKSAYFYRFQNNENGTGINVSNKKFNKTFRSYDAAVNAAILEGLKLIKNE